MKRGNIFFWFAAAVALMAIAGCAKTVHTPENGEQPIGFNVQEPTKAAITGADDIFSFEVLYIPLPDLSISILCSFILYPCALLCFL